MVGRAMLNKRWMNPIFVAYIVTHIIMVVGFPFLNKGKHGFMASGSNASKQARLPKTPEGPSAKLRGRLRYGS